MQFIDHPAFAHLKIQHSSGGLKCGFEFGRFHLGRPQQFRWSHEKRRLDAVGVNNPQIMKRRSTGGPRGIEQGGIERLVGVAPHDPAVGHLGQNVHAFGRFGEHGGRAEARLESRQQSIEQDVSSAAEQAGYVGNGNVRDQRSARHRNLLELLHARQRAGHDRQNRCDARTGGKTDAVQGARAFFTTMFKRGEQVIAEVKSTWCCIDVATMRPARLARDVVSLFLPN